MVTMKAMVATAFLDSFALENNGVNIFIIVVVNVLRLVFFRIDGTIKTIGFATIYGFTIFIYFWFFTSSFTYTYFFNDGCGYTAGQKILKSPGKKAREIK